MPVRSHAIARLIASIVFLALCGAGCAGSGASIRVNPSELARTHVCEPPRSYRVYWILYGSVPIHFPSTEEFPPRPGVLYVFEENRSTVDYSLTLILGTLFSISTARLQVMECQSAGNQSGLKELQRSRDEKLEEERRIREARQRARNP